MSNWKKRLARLFKPGLMPEDVKAVLEAEGIMFFAEQVRMTIIYRNFRAPGRRYGHKRAGATGSLALTSKRVAGLAYSKWIIHVPFDDPKFKALEFSVEKNKYLSASFDPSVFDPAQSGHIEVRYYLPNPMLALDILNQKK